MNLARGDVFTFRQAPVVVTLFILVLGAVSSLCAQSSNLDGIAHVALRVADLGKSRQFYESLGFEKAFEFAEAGKTTELFMKINDRQFVELYPRTQDSQPIGLMHVCYEVNDIELARDAYLKQGLNPPEAKKFRAGNLLFVLHDPDGQVVEYTQYSPGSLHAEDKGKHLGEHRLSSQLQAVVSPVKDASAEQAFYVDKLRFNSIDGNRNRLRLPGSSGHELGLEGEAEHPQIVFSVEQEKTVAESLEQRGLHPATVADGVSVSDPDGTIIVFRPSRRDSHK
jgi:catechol 2,3-dioxygenase-like lactoylglutathione lyase family enzyme